jgi:anti-sigma factor RsiW
MTMPVTETDLHAYVDGLLPPGRCDAVDAHLAAHPDELQRVREWRGQNRALHELFDPVLEEPVPARLRKAIEPRPRRQILRYAAGVLLFVFGGATGWLVHEYSGAPAADRMTAFAHQAAIAHVVYSPEVRHPVEVGADQEAHLVAWLSKRLGANLKVPQLGEAGYQLVGGRLLPGNQGPVAQFMYQDGNGLRLTLYVRTNAAENRETAFRYALERGVSVFYWVDGRSGYALSGEIEKPALLRIAKLVYQQLNP